MLFSIFHFPTLSCSIAAIDEYVRNRDVQVTAQTLGRGLASQQAEDSVVFGPFVGLIPEIDSVPELYPGLGSFPPRPELVSVSGSVFGSGSGSGRGDIMTSDAPVTRTELVPKVTFGPSVPSVPAPPRPSSPSLSPAVHNAANIIQELLVAVSHIDGISPSNTASVNHMFQQLMQGRAIQQHVPNVGGGGVIMPVNVPESE